MMKHTPGIPNPDSFTPNPSGPAWLGSLQHCNSRRVQVAVLRARYTLLVEVLSAYLRQGVLHVRAQQLKAESHHSSTGSCCSRGAEVVNNFCTISSIAWLSGVRIDTLTGQKTSNDNHRRSSVSGAQRCNMPT
eukprot:scaffold43297_cov16-Prasinocladus_malaysianus.AAC.1